MYENKKGAMPTDQSSAKLQKVTIKNHHSNNTTSPFDNQVKIWLDLTKIHRFFVTFCYLFVLCIKQGEIHRISPCHSLTIFNYESISKIQSTSSVVFIFSRTSGSSRVPAILPRRSRCSSPIPAIPNTN